ncbi:SPOR domain-containing protein [Thalassovita taeanensis]|uniref:Sporulation related domain-containing protein n=1 Tax=Thalassovita taeanensis TaxID=657014 RepID=A0A1H8YT00_9RHOB|nr:SPOR domain-containing protein [Thalassovita taeanensis]SEP55267.1 Sporulation related domain-containing protein [Thalassovita taeanensis]
MAELQVNGRDAAPATGNSIGLLANWAGAIVSLGLVVGVGVWGYQLLMRDVSGVPVVRAAEGPMRVLPENPGGAPAENQGLAVNQVAAIGVAEAPADRLILAPRPIDLSDEDTPVAMLSQVRLSRDAVPDDAGSDTAETVDPTSLTVTDLVAQLTEGVAPMGTAPDTSANKAPAQQAPAADKKTVLAESPAAAPVVAKKGLATSLRPQMRPKGGRQVASVDPAVTAQALSVDVDAGTLPAGTRLAQLGAFDSPEVAKTEWDRLSARFSDYLEGKKRVIQKAESGGRTFYRLRAHGFADLNDARRFCSALVAEKAECIPVTSK